MITTIHHPYQLNLNNNLYLVFGVKVKAIVHARTRRCGWLSTYGGMSPSYRGWS